MSGGIAADEYETRLSFLLSIAFGGEPGTDWDSCEITTGDHVKPLQLPPIEWRLVLCFVNSSDEVEATKALEAEGDSVSILCCLWRCR